ncbi:MAG: flippase-like domain-containing protein [Deltaproteobacteria bacterium]|nr:flippase-like domain-containing protein [Deltaproteobacteria bacterium]
MKGTLLHLLLGALILGGVLWSIELDKVVLDLHRLDFYTLTSAAIALVGFHLLKGMRWRLILQTQNIPYGFLDALKMYWSGLFIGTVTPGRLGELIRIVYLKQDGVRIGKGLVGVVADRLLDLGVLVVLLASGIGWLGLGKGAAQLALLWKGGGGEGLRLGGRWLVAAQLREALDTGRVDLAEGLVMLWAARRKLVQIIALTCVSWGLYIWILKYMIEAVGLRFGLGQTVLFFAVAGIAAIIPISLAGIGTRDVMLVYLARVVGQEGEVGLLFSYCVLWMHLLTALVGAVGWSQGRRLHQQLQCGPINL